MNLDKEVVVKYILAKMPSKVPPNYFIYPEFLAFVFLPITWVLLPVAGFQPNLLADYLPPDIFQSISKAQVSRFTDFSPSTHPGLKVYKYR